MSENAVRPRVRSAVAVGALVSLLASTGRAGPPPAGEEAGLLPGAIVALDGPFVVEGEAEGLPGHSAFMDSAPLRAFANSFLPLQRSSACVVLGHPVTLSESDVVGAGGGNVVAAQIAGEVDVRGFLFVSGAASACAIVVVNVRDVTEPDAPRLVASQEVAVYRLDAELTMAIGGEVEVGGEAGFPYAGASASGGIGVELGIAPQLQFVRDRLEFALEAPLRRGRTYQVQLKLAEETSVRLAGGQAIASFFSPIDGGPELPNPFDPTPSAVKGSETSWLDVLRPMAGSIPNLGTRKGNADVVARSVDVGLGVIELGSVWDQSVADVLNPFGFLDAGQAVKRFRGHDLFDDLFSVPPLDITTLVTNSAFLKASNDSRRESIVTPGVHLSNLTLSLDQDRIELAERARNDLIEDTLVRGRRVARLYLPEANGGELERCLALVEQLIERTEHAGLDLSGARKRLQEAQQAAANGKSKKAYDLLCSAYRKLTLG